MLAAAAKALSQILSPPMRSILWKSIGMALVFITVLAIGMQRFLNWAATAGGVWAEGMVGSDYHSMVTVLTWVLSIAAGLSVVAGAIFLMPAITSLVASIFVDDVADMFEVDGEGDDLHRAPSFALVEAAPHQLGHVEFDGLVETVDEIVHLGDLVDQRTIARHHRGHHLAQHDLDEVAHAQRLAGGVGERQ